jgi:ATP-binding cassette subfamily F protein 3
VITVSGISKAHGPRTLFRDVTFRLLPGRRVALVGSNGAGKTTLLEIIVGLQDADSGDVHRSRERRIGYLPQEQWEARSGTVLDEVLGGADHIRDIEEELETLTAAIATTEGAEHDRVLARYGDAQSRFEQLGGYSLEANARRILGGLGFRETDADRPFAELSGGWQMRASLARLMLSRPDVLVLDEPTNHLDTDSIAWLEQQLANYEGAILFVSHDRDFIDAVAERVIEVAGGTATEYVGGFAEFVVQREERFASAMAAAAQQAREVEKVERFIERFRYKATKAKQVQSRIKTLEKLDRIAVPDQAAIVAKFAFPEPRRSGRVVIEMDSVDVGYDGVPLLRDVNLVVERGHKLALVGPNGAGKSTLLKLLLGSLTPMRGTAQLGNQVDVAYFAQHQVDTLDLTRTVYQEFVSLVGAEQPKNRNLRTVLGSFGFGGDAAERRVGDLSGGERTRLALAVCMANPVNLLILDEPTNHLDLVSCDVLQDALGAYPGTILLVSHDRYLVRSVAQDLLEVRNGTVTLHHGVDEAVLSPSFEGGTVGPSSNSAPSSQKTGAKQKTEPASKKRSAATANGSGAAKPSRSAADKAAQKRNEAQDRQARYRASKDLKREIERTEKALARAEAEVAELNRLLADPSVYGDADRVAELSKQFGEAKDRATDLMEKWADASAKLEALEEPTAGSGS